MLLYRHQPGQGHIFGMHKLHQQQSLQPCLSTPSVNVNLGMYDSSWVWISGGPHYRARLLTRLSTTSRVWLLISRQPLSHTSSPIHTKTTTINIDRTDNPIGLVIEIACDVTETAGRAWHSGAVRSASRSVATDMDLAFYCLFKSC